MQASNSKFVLALLPALVLAACGGSSDGAPPMAQLSKAQSGSRQACESLAGLQLANTRITAASAVPAGPLAGIATPEHCLVRGLMHERTGVNGAYAIGFEVRLPGAWNGRFFHQVNGGADGVVSTAAGAPGVNTDSSALSMGFAVLSSDAGHNGEQNNVGPGHFGLDPQARLDYGYQAVGKLTPMARALVQAAYGRAPDRMYLGGCSNGGRHAMVAASRYADQYDGILAGNPGFNLPRSAVQAAWDTQQLATVADSPAQLSTAFTVAELDLVADRVVARCDALDGARDGMVLDVAACQGTFDLRRDVPDCSGARDGSCLTPAQKTVMERIFAGARTTQGQALYTTFPYDPGLRTSGWTQWKYDRNVTLTGGSLPYVFNTPPRALAPDALLTGMMAFSMDTDARLIDTTGGAFTESAMAFMSPPEPARLHTLRDRGAKLMVFHGTADPVFSSDDTQHWYQALRTTHGAEDTAGFARYYPVPGMNHCRGGMTTDRFDMLSALVAWVEEGQAPQRIDASVRAANTDLAATGWAPTRTRPLCAWPQVARYKGGDIESAASFTCE